MKVSFNHIIVGFVLVSILIGLNVWQFRNPRILEVPEYIQTPIDSTAWVQRSAYVNRGLLLDSLRNENQALAERIRESRDQIANYTSIVGRLQIQIDSLETITRIPLPPIAIMARDTTLHFSRTFGDGLFLVNSRIGLTPDWIQNDLDLEQLRDLRLSVVNTFNPDRSRILTYVTSPDFDHLQYQTYTELQPRKQFPWFWAGVATGATGILGVYIILN